MLRAIRACSGMVFWSIIVWLMCLSTHLGATCWYVRPDGSSECSGLNWASPLASIEEAIERASAGDRIYVAEGVYTAKIRYNDSLAPCASFRLKDGVSILGGFAGYEDNDYIISHDDGAFLDAFIMVDDRREVHDRDGNGVIEAWEHTHETVLTLPEGCIGPVLDSGNERFEKFTMVSGFTIRGGRAVGREGESVTPGCGGGAHINGRVYLSQCYFEDNSAVNGGAIYAQGDAWIVRSRFIRNDASQAGGAIYFQGDPEQVGYFIGKVRSCVFSDNGDEQSCVRGGGALYTTGLVETDFCTFVGNASHGAGSAVATADAGGAIRNSVIWGNFGHLQELYAREGTEVERCAVPAGGSAGTVTDNCIMLAPENCGENGIESNDSTPACYYPCFVDVPAGNFSLGAGSCLIGRSDYYFNEQQSLLRKYYLGKVTNSTVSYVSGMIVGYDARAMAMHFFNASLSWNDWPTRIVRALGAYDTLIDTSSTENPQFNFAISVGLEHDLYYGESAKVIILAERMNFAEFSISVDNPEVLSIKDGVATALSAGTCTVTVGVEPIDRNEEKKSFWEFKPFERSFDVTVLPRPLKIKIEDVFWKSELEARPQLGWRIQSGVLKAGDTITGEPYCAAEVFPDDVPCVYPITAGTLAISPDGAGKNYTLEFIDGVMKCGMADDTLLLQDLEVTYSGYAAVPLCSYAYGEVGALDWSYTRVGESQSFEGCPIYPGEYVVTASDGTGREGSCIVRINKAQLYCTAVDKYRAYGEENPELTCIWEGFIGNDTPEILDEVPQLSTTAKQSSSVSSKGYLISISGGSDYRYDIVTQDGRLYISETTPRIYGLVTEYAEYGEYLEDIWLSAYAVDPDSGEYVNGEFLWDEPTCIPDVGEHHFTWTFVPDDTYTYGYVSGESTVEISAREIALRIFNASKPYGESDPEFEYTFSKGELAGEDTLEVELAREAGEEVGVYPINLKEARIVNSVGRDVTSNYVISSIAGNFTIMTRKLTLLIDSVGRLVASSEAGEPELTWSITEGALLDGDSLDVTLQREEGMEVGTYAIDISKLIVPSYYDVEVIPAEFTIYPSGLYVGTYSDSDEEMFMVSDIPYGTRLNGREQIWGRVFYFDEYLGEEVEVSGHFEWFDEFYDTTIYSVGFHNFDWIFIPDEPLFEEVLEGKAQLRVVQATLKAELSHSPAPLTYGEEITNDGVTVTLSGFIGADTVESLKLTSYCNNPTFTYEGYDGSGKMEPGKYLITGMKSNLGEFSNYKIVMAGRYYQQIMLGELVSASAKFSSGRKSLTYGEKLETLSLTGWGTDALGQGVTGTFKWVNGASYPEVGTQTAKWVFTPTNRSCYRQSSLTGESSFTVAPAPLTITVRPVIRKAGEENPAFTLVYTGFVAGDNKNVLTVQPRVTCNATAASSGGVYTISVSGAEAKNYKITCKDSTLTVKADEIRVKSGTEVVAVGNLTYGQRLQNLQLKGTFVNSSTGEEVTGNLKWLEPDTILSAGTHEMPWVFTYKYASGFTTTTTGTLTVKVAKATLKCYLPKINYEATYGDDKFSVDELKYSGFVNGEDASVLAQPPIVLTTRTARSAVGSYPLLISGGAAQNYIFEQTIAWAVTQKPRAATIVVEPQSSPAYAGDLGADEICWVQWHTDGILEGDEVTGKLQRASGNAVGSYAYNLNGFSTENGNYFLSLSGEKNFIIERHPAATTGGESVTITVPYEGKRLDEILTHQKSAAYAVTAGKNNANAYVYGDYKANAKENDGWPYAPGSYSIKCHFTPENTNTHVETDVMVNLTIEPRMLEITTTYPEITYGDEEHFTGTKYIGTLLTEDGELLEAKEGYGTVNGETVVLHWDLPEGKPQATDGVKLCKPILDAVYLADGRKLPLERNPYRFGESVMLEMKIARKKVTPILVTTSNVLVSKKSPLYFTFDQSEVGYEGEEPSIDAITAYTVVTADGSDNYTIKVVDGAKFSQSYCFSTGTFKVVNGLEAQLIVPDAMAEGLSGACTVTALDLADGTQFEIELPNGLNYCKDIKTATALTRFGYPIYFAAGGVYGNGSTNYVSRDCNLIGVEVLKITDASGKVKEFIHTEGIAKPKINGQLMLDTKVDAFGMSYIDCGWLNAGGQWDMSKKDYALSIDSLYEYGRRIELDGCGFHGANGVCVGKLYLLNARNCEFDFSNIGLCLSSGSNKLADDNEPSTEQAVILTNNRFNRSNTSDDSSGYYINVTSVNINKINAIDLTTNCFDGITIDENITSETLTQIHNHLDKSSVVESLQFVPSL